MRSIPLLLLLASQPALAADPAPATAAEPSSPPATAPAPERLPLFGLRLAAGMPQGGNLSLVVRPTRDVRIEAGPAWNYLGWGAQFGVGFQPFHGVVSPVLDLSYGHFFPADASSHFPSAPAELQPLLQNLSYDYLAGLISLEFGSTRGLSFSIGGGVSYFWTTIHQSVTVVQSAGTPAETTVTFTDPAFRAVVPTLKFGVLYYF
jgi:hypothetical protein